MIPLPRFTPIITLCLLTLAAVAGIFLFTRNQPLSPTPPTNGNVFATSIAPLADIARNIAGSAAHIVQVIPPGASPHSYAPTPQDIVALQNSHTLFVIGHSLDDWSVLPAAQGVGVPVTLVDEEVSLREFEEGDHKDEDVHEEGSVDPHYWLTVPNAKRIAQTMTVVMSEYDPENTTTYQENLATYEKELDALEARLQEIAGGITQKKFIAMHDSWSYFASQYGLELVDTYEPVEGREPSVADLNHIQELVAQHGITTFYTEPQKQSTSAVRFLSRELGLDIATLDPVGGIGERATYIGLMEFNMRQLAE